MSDLQWLFLGFYAVIFFVVAVPVLLLILWIINKWVLKGKIRLLYRVLLSIAIPLAFIGIVYYEINHAYYNAYYSTSAMNSRLENIGVGIALPPYEITEYKNVHVIGDDFKDTYQMVFKDTSIKSMQPTLDSLCNANDKWKKKGDEYIFNSVTFETEFNDTLIIRPSKGTATFVRYMW